VSAGHGQFWMTLAAVVAKRKNVQIVVRLGRVLVSAGQGKIFVILTAVAAKTTK